MADEIGAKDAHDITMSRWNAHMQQWNAEIVVQDQLAWDAEKIAADFGKLALQSAILLNGGALLAIPPLMQWLSKNARSQIPLHSVPFVWGLVLACAAVVMAYFNYSLLGEARRSYSRQRGIELSALYAGKEYDKDPAHIRAKSRWRRLSWATTVTAWAALVIGIAAFYLFASGVFEFVALAQQK